MSKGKPRKKQKKEFDRYFSDEGKLINKDIFDENGYLIYEVNNVVCNNYNKFKPNSDIVILYYAENAASATKNNYSTWSLLTRMKEKIL